MKSVTKIELGKRYIVKDIKGEPEIDGFIFTSYMKHLCGKEVVFEKYYEGSGAGWYHERFIFTPGMLLDPGVDEKRSPALEGLGQRIKDLQEAYAGLVKDWQETYTKLVTQQDEFEYPLFMKDYDGEIARFDNLTARTTVWPGDSHLDVGFTDTESAPHTDSVWQPVPYDKERNLWHGQPVEVWNDIETHKRERRFYDVINKKTFRYDGETHGTFFKNIEAIPPEEYKTWMYEAYKTLEGINDPS